MEQQKGKSPVVKLIALVILIGVGVFAYRAMNRAALGASKAVTGIDMSSDLLLDITPAMTPEQVRAKAGDPHEVRADDYQQWWIYGPDSNEAVIFMDGKVVLVNPDIRGLNKFEQDAVRQYNQQP